MTLPVHMGPDVDDTHYLNRRTGRTVDMVQSAVWHAMQGHNVVIVHPHYHHRHYAAHFVSQELERRRLLVGDRPLRYEASMQFYIAVETDAGSAWIQFTETDRLDQWVRGRSPVEVFKDHTCYEHEHRKIRAMLKAA